MTHQDHIGDLPSDERIAQLPIHLVYDHSLWHKERREQAPAGGLDPMARGGCSCWDHREVLAVRYN